MVDEKDEKLQKQPNPAVAVTPGDQTRRKLCGLYSGMLKSPLVRISNRRLWFGSNNGLNTKTSEIQTFLFRFKMKIYV